METFITNMNRKKMEELDIFVEFLLYKAVVMEYALEDYDTTLYIDSDIVLLNKMDLLIDKTCDVGLSPHHILSNISFRTKIWKI